MPIAYKPGERPGVLYLAAPYSHPDPAVRAARADLASQCAAWLTAMGHNVISPLSMGHHMATAGQEIGLELPVEWARWRVVCLRMLEACDGLAVLMLEGAAESRGVNFELGHARSLGMPCNQLRPVFPGEEREGGCPFAVVQNPEWW